MKTIRGSRKFYFALDFFKTIYSNISCSKIKSGFDICKFTFGGCLAKFSLQINASSFIYGQGVHTLDIMSHSKAALYYFKVSLETMQAISCTYNSYNLLLLISDDCIAVWCRNYCYQVNIRTLSNLI